MAAIRVIMVLFILIPVFSCLFLLGLQPTPTINAADQADAQPRRANKPLYNGIRDPIPTVNVAIHMNTRQRRLKSAIFFNVFRGQQISGFLADWGGKCRVVRMQP